ncbi:MAG: hypothetical protein RIB98_00220 [Acidimicrobiales bacterium]
MKIRFVAALAALSLAGAGLLANPAQAAAAGVSSQADFLAAVEAANADPSISEIVFAPNAVIELSTEVRYSGVQDLTLVGRGATISGAMATADTDTWDSGLFVSESGGDLTVRRLTFADSFNNGLAVFLPEGSGTVEIVLDKVNVTDAQFHGVLVDGQATTGYNTDDFIHPTCVDPHPVDSGISIDITVDRSTITGAGQLDGYDISQDTGCPQDFDGLRVDQGGAGDLVADLDRSTFDGNLADGVELDEKGDGSVEATVDRSSFNDNGDTVAITCTVEELCGDDFGETIEDLDDGFDIDEEDAGDLIVSVSRSEVNDNRDEGMDMDEAGEGSIVGIVAKTEAARNGDEGYKASEAGPGDNTADISKSVFEDAGNDQIEVESADGDGSGTVTVKLSKTTSTGAEGSGAKAVEDDGGAVVVTVDKSTLSDNGEWGVEAEGGSGSVNVAKSDLSGNNDGEVEFDI